MYYLEQLLLSYLLYIATPSKAPFLVFLMSVPVIEPSVFRMVTPIVTFLLASTDLDLCAVVLLMCITDLQAIAFKLLLDGRTDTVLFLKRTHGLC